MSHFANDEIAFDVPDDWTDASLTSFVFPEAETNIALAKRRADVAVPLGAYTVALVRALQQAYPNVAIVDRREVRVGATKGERITLEHDDRASRVRNIVVLALRGPELWSLAARIPVAQRETAEAVVTRTLGTFEVLP